MHSGSEGLISMLYNHIDSSHYRLSQQEKVVNSVHVYTNALHQKNIS